MITLPEASKEIMAFVAWLLSGGLSGAVTYVVMEADFLKLGPGWTSEYRRYLAFAVSFALSALLYVGVVALGLSEQPEMWRGWAVMLIFYGLTGAFSGQIVHARKKLAGRKPAA